MSIHLQNTGVVVLVFQSVQTSPNFAQTNTCQPSVAVGAGCDIHITFNPTTTGPLTGKLTVSTNSGGPPYEVQLNGTGVLPAPGISPASLTFNRQDIGTSSSAQQVTVTNNAAIGLNITSLEISKGWKQNNNCQPSLDAHASCTINVSFQPNSSGPVNGALSFTDYAANSPHTVTLSGTGLGGTAVWLSSSSLAFPNQRVGTPSASPQITLQNTGGQTLSITSISLTGGNTGDFTLSQNCGNSLEARASCQITLGFVPTANGARSSTVSVVDSAGDSPQTISLSGTGIDH